MSAAFGATGEWGEPVESWRQLPSGPLVSWQMQATETKPLKSMR
jgi:hypothetical protein